MSTMVHAPIARVARTESRIANRPAAPAAEIAEGGRHLMAPHVTLRARRRSATAVKLNWLGLAR